MKFFKWSSELTTGIKVIDEQHQEVGRRINVFLKYCADQSCEPTELVKTFNYLRLYCIEHFGLEEELMAEYKYPHAEAHHKAHRHFRKWVEGAARRLPEGKLTTNFILEINYHLVEHLEKHFRTVDVKLTEFLMKLSESTMDHKLHALISGILGGKR